MERSSCVGANAQIRQAAALVRAAVASAVPEEVTAADAAQLVESLGMLEKLVSASVLRYGRRTGAGAAGLLAGALGTAAGAAKRRIDAAEQIDLAPAVKRAFCAGALSVDQAAAIAPAAVAVPDAAGALVDAAKGSSLRELKLEAARTMRRARSEDDEVARERALHTRRYCRAWAATGGVRLEALLTAVEGGRLLAALEKETEAVFHESWRARGAAGGAEPRERLAADALVRLVTGSAQTSGAHLVVRVDAATLVRGDLEGGEICEVEGVGPISVDAARSLLGDGFATLLVHDGDDIKTVTSTSRVIPRKVRVALEARDPACVVPGCGASRQLEIDHWRTDFSAHGPTELDNLCRLCATHHRMKTREGWRIGGGPGKWQWVPPRAGP